MIIPGIILAAGRSTRMGQSKALLTLPGSGVSFVARIAATLLAGGLSDALVVGRSGDRELRDEVERIPGRVRFVENPHADRGQLSSLLAGLNAVDRPGTRGILVTLVDLPLVEPATIATLLAAFSSSSNPIARVTHFGVHGHPVIFSRAMFEPLRRADPQLGAKGVVHANPVLDVEVPDPGVLRDIDTPEDYRTLG